MNRWALVWAQGSWELRNTLRNGEQLLLVIGIPVLLILVGSWLPALQIAPQTDGIAPIIAACVLASGFTSLAIATAFERRAAALTFLGTTPLGRSGLLLGKFLAVGLTTGISASAVVIAAVVVGWRPQPMPLGTAILLLLALLLASITCASWGFLLAGLLRAEAVLAAANAMFLLLVLLGGIAIPVTALPGGWDQVVQILPTVALITALREPGDLPGILTLLVWSLLGCLLALRFFRWDDRRA